MRIHLHSRLHQEDKPPIAQQVPGLSYSATSRTQRLKRGAVGADRRQPCDLCHVGERHGVKPVFAGDLEPCEIGTSPASFRLSHGAVRKERANDRGWTASRYPTSWQRSLPARQRPAPATRGFPPPGLTATGGDILSSKPGQFPGSGACSSQESWATSRRNRRRRRLTVVPQRRRRLGADAEYFQKTTSHVHYPPGRAQDDLAGGL